MPYIWIHVTGVIIHEIMHALGIVHEQSRPDRDSFVKVVWDVIPAGLHVCISLQDNLKHMIYCLDRQQNFDKYSSSAVDTLGVPCTSVGAQNTRNHILCFMGIGAGCMKVDVHTQTGTTTHRSCTITHRHFHPTVASHSSQC
jgi:hypothetical protein